MNNNRIPCVIYKCTPTLIKKLQEMGYSRVGATGYDIIVTYASNTFSTYSYEQANSFEEMKSLCQCGRNDTLFLALAALSEKTDLHQWFVHPNGNWEICRCDSFKDMWGEEYDIYKASSAEIFDKFTTVGNDEAEEKLEQINNLVRMLPDVVMCKISGDEIPWRRLTGVHYDGLNTLFVFGMKDGLPLEVYFSEIEKILS